MEILFNLLIFIVSIVGLYYGANFLIKGSVNIANYFHISKMVIALTLVAAGTSMPEFFVTLIGTIKGKTDISVGNIIGSNIANITLVLGLATVIFPFRIKKQTKMVDFPIVILTTLIFYIFLMNGVVGRSEGIILFIMFLMFNFFYLFYFKKRSNAMNSEYLKDDEKVPVEIKNRRKFLIISFAFVSLGIVFLYVASHFLIKSAIFFAHKFHVSEAVIGVTMVAIGTSIPEIFTSVIAAMKKEDDISFGNVLGSNFLNITMVMGTVAFINPFSVNAVQIPLMKQKALFMIIATAAIFPFAFLKKMKRIYGIFMLIIYTIFIYLVFS